MTFQSFDMSSFVTVGIVENNSLAYIRAVFDALQKQSVVVPLRSEDDSWRIDAAHVANIISPVDGGGWFNESISVPNGHEVGHISFTSGTEGDPKGVLISRSALNDVVDRIQCLMKMDSSVKEYVGVPVYHSFGYGRCRHVASVGGSFYIPSHGFDAKEFVSMLAKGEVNALSLVPSLLRVLLNNPKLLGEERLLLRWLEIGSQAMSKTEKLATRELFPNACIVQHYGLTEASRTTLLQIDNASDDVLDSVGKCYGNVEVSINHEGCICISGDHVASALLIEGNSVSAVNNQGWLETTDLGFIKDGFLYYDGRADNVVNCGGQKLSTERLEKAVMDKLASQGLNQVDMAVSRIPDATYGEGFLVSYTDGHILESLKASSVASLRDLGISAQNAMRYFNVDSIPKTPTGKVQHKILSALFKEQSFVNTESLGTHHSGDDIFTLFVQTLGLQKGDLSLSDSVMSIGVDSLQSVQLSIKIESFLGYLPQDWRQQSIDSLSKLPIKKTDAPLLRSSPANGGKAQPLWDGSSNKNPGNIRFFELIKEDFNTHDRDLFSQGLWAVFVHRFGNWRMGVKTKVLRFPLTLLYRFLRKLVQLFCGIKLDYTVLLGRRVKLEHFGGMILGAREIGDDTIIRQNTTFGIRDMSDLSAKPTIERGVNIGAGAVIVGDIVVGRYSVIGPNSVVTEDVPPFSVVAAGATIVSSVDQQAPKNEDTDKVAE